MYKLAALNLSIIALGLELNMVLMVGVPLQLRGQPHSSALELVGNGHEGVYLCAVRHMGVVIVQHAFIVEEPIPKTSKSIFQLSFKFCMELKIEF